ncbi:FadR family transcriptional regulator [Rhodococcus fascians]|nr:FadR family transcriptional regulator [Rhodococcus fascians]MBY4238752.1 FadR family transcriptional regulator [Rhodococcus fascians]MBY4254659.1 FadR family transcriptional regulator [Rhodococcus fascians]MBY4270107.1 FadR family transcriptional regulator [Rhodococcus fascians]
MAVSGRPQKVSMLVAQQIIRDVNRDGIQPGQLLPPERVMLEKYEIGRGTLREALRLLEFQGAIALKPGPKGGPVLLSPNASHLADNLMLLMDLKGAPFRHVVEMRSILEPEASRLAALRINDEALSKLASSVNEMRDQIDDEYAFLQANKQFHDVIAWASENPLLGYFTESLSGIMDGTVMGIDYPMPRRKAILAAHEEIFQSIADHDGPGAEKRMREHIDAYIKFSKKKYPKLLERPIQWGPTF